MMKIKKDFDAVKMMRDIRQKHHEEYEKNPGLREKRLAEIQKKFKSLTRKKEYASH
jgi:hypothetical protein